MQENLTKIYEGANLSGAITKVIYLPILEDATLNGLDVLTDEAVTSDVSFSLSINGVELGGLDLALDEAENITIPDGDKIVSLTGLAIELEKGDEVTLNLLSGAVSSPLTLNLSVDDGQTAGTTLTQTTATATTASIADTVSENGTVGLGKYAILSKLEASRACRVRLYSTAAYRTLDAARAIGVDPVGEHGVLLDAVLTADNLTLDLSPVVQVFDGASPRTGNIFYSIQNRSGATGTVSVIFTKLTFEA